MSIYEVTVNGRQIGNDVQNVYCFQHPAMDATILQNTITQLHDELLTQVALWQSDDYRTETYTLRRVDVPGYPGVLQGWDTPIQGVKPDDPLPTQIALLALLVSPTLAPNRGRKYFGGFAEGGTSANAWVTGLLDDVIAGLEGQIGYGVSQGGSGADWVIPRWGLADPDDPGSRCVIAWNPIKQGILVNIPRTQKRRTPGFGS